MDSTPPRSRIETDVVHRGFRREFIGFNRARHAVLETAIYATRVHMLARDFLESELVRLQVIVDKTAGPNEHEAMALLAGYIRSAPGTSARPDSLGGGRDHRRGPRSPPLRAARPGRQRGPAIRRYRCVCTGHVRARDRLARRLESRPRARTPSEPASSRDGFSLTTGSPAARASWSIARSRHTMASARGHSSPCRSRARWRSCTT